MTDIMIFHDRPTWITGTSVKPIREKIESEIGRELTFVEDERVFAEVARSKKNKDTIFKLGKYRIILIMG